MTSVRNAGIGSATTAFSIVVAVCIVVLTGCGISSSAPALSSNGFGLSTDCTPADSPAGWLRLKARTVEDGLGIYRLRSRGIKVVVVAASLVKPIGGIVLSKVAFQAFDGAGSGVDWDSSVQAIDSTGKPVPVVRRNLPAELTYTAPTGSNVGLDGREWQLTVGLRATGNGGMAQGVKFTYIYQGQAHTITNIHPIGIFPTSADCDRNVVLPRN